MDVRRIHEEINNTLIQLEEQYSRILTYKDQIPTIEVDLALKDVRDLYELFINLKTVGELQRRAELSSQVTLKESDTAVAPVEVAVDASVKKVEEEPVKIETPKMESPKLEELKVEVPKVEEKPAVDFQKTVEAKAEEKKEPVAQAKPVVLPSENPPVVAPKVDLLQERQKDFVPTVRKIEFKPEPQTPDNKKESLFDKAASLYDKIAKPGDKTVAGQATRQPVSNIKGSIGINEKFAYLKELFKNNVNDYNEALDKLNNFDSYADAEDYFQDLKAKYNWDPESKSFQGLADLLNRRYLHNV
jgi:hypothetical protein